MSARSGYTGFPDNRKPPWRNWTEADERDWEAKYQAQREAADEAFRLRGSQPPRHSKVNGPPADWKRWCCLLDGVPVGNCTEFDVDEGWVQVYVVERKSTGMIRIADTPQRRLYGQVTALLCTEYFELKKQFGQIEVTADDLRGEPVPGTEIRLKRY